MALFFFQMILFARGECLENPKKVFADEVCYSSGLKYPTNIGYLLETRTLETSREQVSRSIGLFFQKHKNDIEKWKRNPDTQPLIEIVIRDASRYLMESDKDIRIKHNKLENFVIHNLYENFDYNDFLDKAYSFSIVFSGRNCKTSWIFPNDQVLYLCTLLIMGALEGNVGMDSTARIQDLQKYITSSGEIKEDLSAVLCEAKSIVKKAPFIVGASYDVRPEHDHVDFDHDDKQRIIASVLGFVSNYNPAYIGTSGNYKRILVAYKGLIERVSEQFASNKGTDE